MEIIIGRNAQPGIVITEPSVSKKHCRITADGDGTFIVENLSQSSFTKIDGREIVKAKATIDSEIQLGPVYRAKLRELITTPSGSRETPGHRGSNRPTQPKVKTYSISHLKRIWEEYNRKNLEEAKKSRTIGIVRSGSMIFTMGGGVLATVAALPAIGIVCSGIGVGAIIYSFIGMRKSETLEQKQQRQEEFEDAWVCPNPDCNRSLPARNYKLLIKNHRSCPYCKSHFVEK